MSSPTASIFSSPRSAKRHLPTVSRIGTPSSHPSYSPSKKTPTRFKVKKEYPLVLLHVTVLPLTWTYAHVISSLDLPPSLQGVKENWRLLHEKLGDTVLERGILLPHPQDSYEVLEERLLEALELPVRPSVRILKCGHYMGPEMPSSDEEGRDEYPGSEGRRWCDICGRDVKIDNSGMDLSGERRFRVKIYASNGLMRAGAWAAAWREMERVDVELEPFVEPSLAMELENLAAMTAHAQQLVHVPGDDGFVDEEEYVSERVPETNIDEAAIKQEEEERRRAQEEEEEAMRRAMMEEENRRAQGEEAMRRQMMEEESRRAQEEGTMRRAIMEEESSRDIYGDAHPPADSRPRSARSSPKRVEHGDSLPELLFAAIKVAMRDSKNVAILVLSMLVVLLALRPGPSPRIYMESMARESGLQQVNPGANEPVKVPPPADNFSPKPVNVHETARNYAPVIPEVLKDSAMTLNVPETVRNGAAERPVIPEVLNDPAMEMPMIPKVIRVAEKGAPVVQSTVKSNPPIPNAPTQDSASNELLRSTRPVPVDSIPNQQRQVANPPAQDFASKEPLYSTQLTPIDNIPQQDQQIENPPIATEGSGNLVLPLVQPRNFDVSAEANN
jgi:hypothetical protein